MEREGEKLEPKSIELDLFREVLFILL